MKSKIFNWDNDRNIPFFKINTINNWKECFTISKLNLGEKRADWLGDFEGSNEETRFSRSWSWEMSIEFVSSWRLCVLIWFFNSLILALSCLTYCFNPLTVIGLEW